VIANGGSTRSIGNVVSQLKTICESRGKVWLGDKDKKALIKLIRRMKLEDITTSRQKRPLQLHHLLRLVNGWDLREPEQLRTATMLFVCHDGLLRSGELLSGLKVQDFLWNADRTDVNITLFRTKTCREGEGAKVTIGDYTGVSGVKLLRRWFDQQSLWHQPDHHAFPSSKGSGQYDFGKTASISWWRRKIKFCVKVLGLDPTFYSGHSLRAGGATDLFVQRVPYYLIKRMGRWKSDAAMLYYRSEEDVRTAVARAFGEIGHVWKRGGGMNLKCEVYLGGVPCAEVKYLAP
jgi:integrase